jgi:hypothetical protein
MEARRQERRRAEKRFVAIAIATHTTKNLLYFFVPFFPGGVPLSSLVTYYRCSNLLVTHIKQFLKAQKKCGVCQFEAFKNFKIIKTYYSFLK